MKVSSASSMTEPSKKHSKCLSTADGHTPTVVHLYDGIVLSNRKDMQLMPATWVNLRKIT